jgi:hypothetical protein
MKEIDQCGYWKPRMYPKIYLQKANEIFDSINGNVIVEIGSGLKGAFNGNSLLTWIQSKTATEIYCIDPDPRALKDISDNVHDERVKLINSDGMEFFKNQSPRASIDLLYLDYWSERISGDNYLQLGEERGQSHLALYKLAVNKLSDTSMILIDDTDHIAPWKDTYIIPRAIEDGYRIEWIGRQTLLTKGI